MTPLIIKYPLDLTGQNPNNLVIGEPHEMVRRKVRAVATNYGPFFTESLKVYDAATGRKLIPGLASEGGQYVAAELYQDASTRAGQEICAIIVITDESVGDTVLLDYQVVGGEFSSSVSAIAAMIEALDLDERPVKWGDVLGKPSAFTPAKHLHDIGDIYGFEYIVEALERVRMAILMGDVASHDEIYRYIDRYFSELDGKISTVANDLASHRSNFQNPHQVTKAQVGLGNVDNYATATQQDAEAGTATNLFMTPLRVKQAIDKFALIPLNTHMSDHNNPHQVTATQVGLGLVQNYSMATQGEAETGALATRYMSPLTVKQAIAYQALIPLNAHIGNTSNPHNVTKAQVGLGLVDNYATATNTVAAAGSSTTTFVTPAGVKSYVDTNVMPTVTAHINNVNNPHGTTAAQVGAYTIAQTNDLLNQRLPIGGTAVNSNLLQGLSYAQVYNNARANLPAENITSGYISPLRLGNSWQNNGSFILCADGAWRSLTDLAAFLGIGGAGVWAGQTSAENAMATYQSRAAGTILLVQVVVPTSVGTGNGSVVQNWIYQQSFMKIAAGNNWQWISNYRIA